MLSLEGVDAGGVLEGIIRTQEQVFQKRWAAAILELVFVANRWYGIGPEGILDALGKRFVGYRIELVEVLNDVREVLDGTVRQIVTGTGRRQPRRAVALKGRDGRRTAPIRLLVGKSHPHRGLAVDPGSKRKVVGVGDFTRQADLLEHDAVRRDSEQPAEVWGADGPSVQSIAALEQPIEHVIRVCQDVTPKGQEHVVVLDHDRNREGLLADARVRRRDIGWTWHGFLECQPV